VGAVARPPGAKRMRKRGRDARDRALDSFESRSAHLRNMLARYVPPERGAAIVDLGCGHGAFIHFARDAGYLNVEGYDISREQVALASQLGVPGVVEAEALQALAGMDDSSKDVVAALDVIEHFSRRRILQLVTEVRRVLRPGGRWVIHTPNGASPFAGRVIYGDWTHRTVFSRESLSHILLDNGFSSVECFEDRPVAHGLKSAVRRMIWLGIRGGIRLCLAAETGITDADVILTQNFVSVATK
jgi:2-polyprenyl-3-methyl-5-hydroxy-6-metoxy-1,4-benzoquinol methylase